MSEVVCALSYVRYLIVFAASVLFLVGCSSVSSSDSPEVTSEVSEPAEQESAPLPTAEDCAIYGQAFEELFEVLFDPDISDEEFKSAFSTFERAMPAPFEELGEMMMKNGEMVFVEEETTGQKEEAVRLRALVAVADIQCAEFE